MQLYLEQPEFNAWIHSKNFTLLTDINITKYYSLFEFTKMCYNRECHNCSGYAPAMSSEEDIGNNTLTYTACEFSKSQTDIKLATQFAQREHLPKAFRGLTFKDIPLVTDNVTEYFSKYIEKRGNLVKEGIYLYTQEHGIGRTTALWLFLKELINTGLVRTGFIFHTVPIFMDKLQIDLSTKDHPFVKKALTCDFLILDDFGKEKSHWTVDKLDAIIEERCWNKKPVMLSSTIPPEDWAWETAQEKSLLSKIRRSCESLEIKPETLEV